MTTSSVCSPCLRGVHKRCQAPESCSCATCNAPEGFAWEDPPPRSQKGGGHPWNLAAAVAEELRRNPKRWARVQTYKSKTGATTRAKAIRAGKTPLDAADWEAESRVVDGASALYVRFVGNA